MLKPHKFPEHPFYPERNFVLLLAMLSQIVAMAFIGDDRTDRLIRNPKIP